jgi:GDPmannose 4,6-dehydratase
MTLRKAIITGVYGQDGSYLAEHLLACGYEVVGLAHRPQALAPSLAQAPAERFSVRHCALASQTEIAAILQAVRPDEVYNFAARASGAGMFDDPAGLGDVNGLAVTRLLEAILATDRQIRFCQASSSEMFGRTTESPQDEASPFHPRSPYGAAKVYAHTMVGIYRNHHQLFCCSAILFNHESPRRSPAFVTRKVTQAAARIKLGLVTKVQLGRLDAQRDWGFAGDHVRAMHSMLQQPQADDYVVATGERHSVLELCQVAFSHVGLNWREHVVEEQADFRTAEAVPLVGNASKARDRLGWIPRVSFRELIVTMVDEELKALQSHIDQEERTS